AGSIPDEKPGSVLSENQHYQSCPMDGFDYEAVGRLINLPPNHVVAMFVVIGKGLAPALPRVGKLPDSEVILTDRFPSA
ncbi:MAG: hypothetical protein ABF826_14500, partial [Komagataeibacter saccharivorans]